MSFVLETLTEPPDPAEFDPLLTEYWTQIFTGLEALGGPVLSPERPVQDFWHDIDKVLPPRGALVLARDESGHLVGCGSLTNIGGGTGELKRLFVRPQARGTGLGRALVTHRMELAREMGLTRVCVDTIRSTTAMQQIYRGLGFTEIPRYAQSASANALPEMLPYMLFFERSLQPEDPDRAE